MSASGPSGPLVLPFYPQYISDFFFKEYYSKTCLKDLYSCPIEIIKGLTDKGQFQYLTDYRIKGASKGDVPVYNLIFFTKINIFTQKEDQKWFSISIIAQCRSKLLQNARAFCDTLDLH